MIPGLSEPQLEQCLLSLRSKLLSFLKKKKCVLSHHDNSHRWRPVVVVVVVEELLHKMQRERERWREFSK